MLLLRLRQARMRRRNPRRRAAARLIGRFAEEAALEALRVGVYEALDSGADAGIMDFFSDLRTPQAHEFYLGEVVDLNTAVCGSVTLI